MFRFTYQPYRYRFPRPIHTHHGVWTERQGIIVRLENATGKTGIGEIAPLSWFGSESFETALQFCQNLSSSFTLDTIEDIPAAYPACQFGFESAWEQLTEQYPEPQRTLKFCGLLPAGTATLATWSRLWQQGYRTFKWKIGVYPLMQELTLFEQLTNQLPQTAKLRLDANGGLTLNQTHAWLEHCDRISSTTIEYLEQPLPPDQFALMQHLAHQYKTPLALDESVATLQHLQQTYQAHWTGIFVLKPAIIGSPRQLRQFLQDKQLEVVFSSVFETEVGYLASLKLARQLSSPTRAVGYSLAPTTLNSLQFG